ncbi:MAG TPA: GNAT family N-acetyltransferase [Phycisphaerae bacterium]|nr:GNAT family N-acetyltransferase [Phycisphaerae bacterium]
MPPFTLRPAAPADIPAILSLIRELANFEHLQSACVATEDLLAEHLLGPQRAAQALVAQLDDALVAYAIYFKTFSTFLARPGLYLEDLYVQPAHRHKGIGTALLTHLAHLCIRNNFGRLEWSVLTWNAPAIAFYQSLGAQPLADWQMMRLTGPALAALATL